MKGRLAGLVVVMLSGVLFAPPAIAGEQRYYISLGDSFAASFQPRGPQDRGYSEQLLEIMRARFPNLELVKLGCVGETSQTMIDGGGVCSYGHGSQLDEALAFAGDHPRQVAFVTIAIGGNDFGACLGRDLTYDPACLPHIIDRLEENLGFTLDALRGAVGPNAPIVGARFFNPWIGLWILGPRGERTALANHESIDLLNDTLVETYADAGSPVADWWTAFSADDFEPVRFRPFGVLPHNAAVDCSLAWLCRAGDIHTTTTGYGVLAESFAQVLPGS